MQLRRACSILCHVTLGPLWDALTLLRADLYLYLWRESLWRRIDLRDRLRERIREDKERGQ